MSDRELLLAAAKAAGLKIVKIILNPDGTVDQFNVEDGSTSYGWNPLAKWGNGAALSLLTRLRLELRHAYGKVHVGRQNQFWYSESYNDDPDAATRRAIVRAAASLSQQG